jgi:hypothetical protein
VAEDFLVDTMPTTFSIAYEKTNETQLVARSFTTMPINSSILQNLHQSAIEGYAASLEM